MRLTVLGRYGAYPAAKGATSGYLLQHEDLNILIDCGSGIISRLQEYSSIGSIDVLILSHLHDDHVADMGILSYALGRMEQRSTPLRVFAPAQPTKESMALRGLAGFEFITITDGLKFRLNDLFIQFCEMEHPYQSFAMRFALENFVFLYTSDTRWNDQLVTFAHNSDVILADCALKNEEKTSEFVAHLTAGECGQLAVMSNAKRLLCTHIFPDTHELSLRKQVSEAFSNAELVRERTIYDL